MRCHYCCRSWKWKMMIGRKIAICTFRKLKWMHWVDFNLPQQNPHFFLSNEWPSGRSRGSAVRKKTAEKKSENVRSIRSSGGLEIRRMMRLSQIKSKKMQRTDIVVRVQQLCRNHFISRLVSSFRLRNFCWTMHFWSVIKFRFCYEWMCRILVPFEWNVSFSSTMCLLVDVGLPHRYGLLTILHSEEAHHTAHHIIPRTKMPLFHRFGRVVNGRWSESLPSRRRIRFEWNLKIVTNEASVEPRTTNTSEAKKNRH